MSGGPAAGRHRDLWPAGPCSEVYHLGYDPPLQRPGALQQGSGTLTGRTTDVSLLPTQNRTEVVNHHNRKQLFLFFILKERNHFQHIEGWINIQKLSKLLHILDKKLV